MMALRHLVHQPLPCVVVHNLLLLKDLDGDRLTRVALDSEHDLAEGALPDGLQERVRAHRLQAAVVARRRRLIQD